jgi:hypothetical protein
MLVEECVRKMITIHHSNNTIRRKIQDMFNKLRRQKYVELKLFATQVDESTDVAYFAVLLVIARYLKGNEVEENLLLCHPLSKCTRDEDKLNATEC